MHPTPPEKFDCSIGCSSGLGNNHSTLSSNNFTDPTATSVVITSFVLAVKSEFNENRKIPKPTRGLGSAYR